MIFNDYEKRHFLKVVIDIKQTVVYEQNRPEKY